MLGGYIEAPQLSNPVDISRLSNVGKAENMVGLGFSYENEFVVRERSVQVASRVCPALSGIKRVELVLCNHASIGSLPGSDMNYSDAECVIGVGVTYGHASATPRLVHFATAAFLPYRRALKYLTLD